MEFTSLPAAIAHANRMANLSNEVRYVLFNGSVYWVCGPFAKCQLWPDREPVYVTNS